MKTRRVKDSNPSRARQKKTKWVLEAVDYLQKDESKVTVEIKNGIACATIITGSQVININFPEEEMYGSINIREAEDPQISDTEVQIVHCHFHVV